MTAALAAETPWWEPGRMHGYHVKTFGFLIGELVRRASAEHVGTFFRRHVAEPLAADFHFGAGGSLGFADPDARLAFAYTMNRAGPRWQNPRNRALIDAVCASL